MSESTWDDAVLTAGERAALRRFAGVMMDRSDTDAWMAYYKALRGNGREDAYTFAALCMQMLWRKSDEPTIRPMEEILRDMIGVREKDAENESLLKRTRGALDTAWADDGFLLGKICNIVRIIRSAHPEWMPDFWMLARELRGWNSEKRWVQRKWVGAIFAGVADEKREDESK